MTAGLDTLLTALYVELTDRIIPARGFTRSGPGQRPEVTDAGLACLAVAQVLLRFDDERHWLHAAPRRVGHPFPRLLGQPEYNDRVKAAAPLMEAALRWLAQATPASAELLRLTDATPFPCGHSVITARRSGLYGWAGVWLLPKPFPLVLGQQAPDHLHLRRDGDRVRPGQPKLYGEREQARQMLNDQPANRPATGTAVVTDKGLAGEETEAFFAAPDLGPHRAAPARAQRLHLVQLADRSAGQTLPHRLRPLSCP